MKRKLFAWILAMTMFFSLAACGGSCEGCNGCGNSGGGRVDAIYQPYIDGEVELADLNAAYSESRKLVR